MVLQEYVNFGSKHGHTHEDRFEHLLSVMGEVVNTSQSEGEGWII